MFAKGVPPKTKLCDVMKTYNSTAEGAPSTETGLFEKRRVCDFRFSVFKSKKNLCFPGKSDA